MAQGTVCNGQYIGTAVMASGDGSGWGSSSGCKNQGSCARQGATVDTGDSGSGKERTVVAKAAVSQGLVVQGTGWRRRWLLLRLRQRLGRGGDGVTKKKPNPTPFL